MVEGLICDFLNERIHVIIVAAFFLYRFFFFLEFHAIKNPCLLMVFLFMCDKLRHDKCTKTNSLFV